MFFYRTGYVAVLIILFNQDKLKYLGTPANHGIKICPTFVTLIRL